MRHQQQSWIFNFSWRFLVFGLLLGFTDGQQSGKYVQEYRQPSGEFLLPQLNDPHRAHEFQVEPPHFHQLRLIRRIEDPTDRELFLQEHAKRVKRSPQFFPKVGDLLRTDKAAPTDPSARSEKSASINVDSVRPQGLGGGLSLGTPKLPGNLGISGGRGGAKLNAGLGDLGGSLELGVPGPEIPAGIVGASGGNAQANLPGFGGEIGLNQTNPNAGINLGGTGAGVGLSVPNANGEANLDGIGVGIGLAVPNANAQANLGGIGADIGAAVPSTNADANLGGVGAGIRVGVPNAKAEANSGGIGGQLGLTPIIPKAEAKLGGFGAGIGVSVPDANAEANLGGIGGKADLNAVEPKVAANIGNFGAGAEADLGKPEAMSGLGKIGDDFEISLNAPSPELSAELGGVAGGEAEVNIPAPKVEFGLGTGTAGLNASLTAPKIELEKPNISLATAPSQSNTTTTTSTAAPTRITSTTAAPTTSSTAKTTTATPTTTTTAAPSSTGKTTTASSTTTTTVAPTTSSTAKTTTDSPTIATTTSTTTAAPTTTSTTSTTPVSETTRSIIITTTADSITTTTEEPEPETVPQSYNVTNGELVVPEGYNALEIPGRSDALEALETLVFVKVLGVHEIDEVKEHIGLDMDLTVEWADSTLLEASTVDDADDNRANTGGNSNSNSRKRRAAGDRSDFVTLSPTFLEKIWRPDIYMEDLVKVEYPTILGKPVVSLKLNKRTGYLSYTVRMTVTVNCPMSFVYYPADTQRCELRLASYTHSKDDLRINWLQIGQEFYGVHLEDSRQANFDLKVDTIEKLEITPKFNNPGSASYDVLTFTIAARRKISYHLTQTYAPSVFHIFVTWLVFLIPYTLYDSRIGTTMTTLLTLTALFSSVRDTSPKVSYMKAIDLWMLACIVFVFLNLVELTLMTWLRTSIDAYNAEVQKAEELNTRSSEKEQEKPKNGNWKDPETPKPITLSKFKNFDKIYRVVQKYSFIGFAFTFLLFNVLYWAWLLSCSKYLSWGNYPEIEL